MTRVPEVVQTSAMDCGPAAATALLRGCGVEVEVDAVRERCATDVDGTSIDALEVVIADAGVPTEQVVVPVDHLLVPAARMLPAIVVVLLPDGATHFVVLWRRRSRGRVEIMDPATGRRTVDERDFLATVYRHPLRAPEEAWFAWATGKEGGGALRERITALGVPGPRAGDLLARAAAEGARAVADLDAATRVAARLRDAGALPASRAAAFLTRLLGSPQHIPDQLRSVRPAPAPEGASGLWVELRGAVAVRVAPTAAVAGPADDRAGNPGHGRRRGAAPARRARGRRTPWREATAALWALPRARLAVALAVLAGCGMVAEALALRAVVAGEPAGLPVAIAVVAGEVGVGWAAAAAARRAGHDLESQLRRRWSARVQHVSAGWVATRPVSDLVDRVHGMHRARSMPWLISVAARAAATALAAAVALVVVLPAAAPAVVAVVLLPALGLVLGWPRVADLDLRARTLAGVLSRFLLDGLLGLSALVSHHAARALRWEQGRSLAQWHTATAARLRAGALVEAVVGLLVLLPVALVVVMTVGADLTADTKLLVLLLVLSLPVAVDELLAVGRLLPDARNRLLRFLGLLTAATEPGAGSADVGSGEEQPTPGLRAAGGGLGDPVDPAPRAPGATVVWSQATVHRGGRPVITDLSLRIEAGQRVAVVGRSGSAKSTLLDTLTGLAEPSTGAVLVDGRRVADDPASARRRTAWVTGRTAVWNRAVDENVSLPHPPDPDTVARAAGAVGADRVRRRLRAALHTPVGAGGRLLSGGEGQLVRAARGVAGADRTAGTEDGGSGGVRLLLADEATRGLDVLARDRLRAGLLAAHPGATVLWVTHDPAEAARFDRVLVMADGAVIEDGPPTALAGAGGPFSALLAAADAPAPPGWRVASVSPRVDDDVAATQR
jgi:ABC-type transport system involved in cytochrome bd biosynthesis fused ATPase/permease subunit